MANSYFEAFTTGELKGKLVHYNATIDALADITNRRRLVDSGQVKTYAELNEKLHDFRADVREIESIIAKRADGEFLAEAARRRHERHVERLRVDGVL